MQSVGRRAAELNGILETASAKIDRFGWDRMDAAIKDQLCEDWCDLLSQYTIAEVRDGVKAVFEASKGKLRSINEYQVQDQIRIAHRAKLAKLPQKSPEPETERDFSPEAVERRRQQSAELLPNLVSTLKMPPDQSEQQTQANINAAKDMIDGE